MFSFEEVFELMLVGVRMFPQRAAMVAKKELRLTPLGPWMTLSGAIWLNRGNSASAVRSLEAAGEEIKREKLSLWIFPEGTRHSSEAPDMLPLKKGGFHLAVQAGVPIIPVVFENYWRLYHRGVFEGGKLKIRSEYLIAVSLLACSVCPFSHWVYGVLLNEVLSSVKRRARLRYKRRCSL